MIEVELRKTYPGFTLDAAWTAGDEVVTSGVFKLRNGAAVVVDNTVKPANSARPRPEDS